MPEVVRRVGNFAVIATVIRIMARVSLPQILPLEDVAVLMGRRRTAVEQAKVAAGAYVLTLGIFLVMVAAASILYIVGTVSLLHRVRAPLRSAFLLRHRQLLQLVQGSWRFRDRVDGYRLSL